MVENLCNVPCRTIQIKIFRCGTVFFYQCLLWSLKFFRFRWIFPQINNKRNSGTYAPWCTNDGGVEVIVNSHKHNTNCIQISHAGGTEKIWPCSIPALVNPLFIQTTAPIGQFCIYVNFLRYHDIVINRSETAPRNTWNSFWFFFS